MKILVMATAAHSGGALTILQQFLSNISIYGDEKDEYYVFISKHVNLEKRETVSYIMIDTTSWIKRIFWDEFGFKKWVKNNKIQPDLIISFQNTGVKFNKVPSIIYYHQPLPLSEKKWSLFNSEERNFFLYKNFYSFFVKRYLYSKTHIVVQIPSIKDSFVKKFKINESQIHVIKPNVNTIDYSKIEVKCLNSDKVHFLYPATPILYKNHIVIVQALDRIKKEYPSIAENICIYFTFNKEDNKLFDEVESLGLNSNFIFEGSLSYTNVLSYYKSVDALLFPSYIESFGLPLIEAASAGLPIIASDLPYAGDVIGDYEGVRFVEFSSGSAWAKAILEICKNKKRYSSYNQEMDNWKYFFELIDKLKK